MERILFLGGVLFVAVGCSGQSQPDAGLPTLVSEVDQQRYEQDLKTVAKARPPGSAHWQVVQDLCVNRLESLGFSVVREDYGTGVNVIGTLKGTTKPDEQVLISAHYDHIAGCAGADDNASGVAGALESARVLASQPRFDRTLIVACWDEEERGLLGSKAYAQAARDRGDQIVMSYVYEMIGYKDDTPDSQTLPAGIDLLFPAQTAAIIANQKRADFVVALHNEHASKNGRSAAAEMKRVGTLLGLEVTSLELAKALVGNPLLGTFLRSDHAYFWEHDYPAMMVGDTANFRYPNYHCTAGPDTPDQLDHGFAKQIIQATISAAAAQLLQ